MGGLTLLKTNPASCKALVVGSGKSGFSALKFLHGLGSAVSLSERADKKTVSKELLHWLESHGVPYETGGHSKKLFVEADIIVVSPGVPLDMEELAAARNAGREIIGEFGLAAAFLGIPVIAVTGTNGKTTVTQLIGKLLEEAGRNVFVGGNIGTPLTEYLLGEQRAEVAVVEASSYQLDTAGDFSPEVALLLNISPDHLDRYESFDAYAASKMSIFKGQKEGQAAIINSDDDEIMNRLPLSEIAARKFFFGTRLKENPGATPAEKGFVLQTKETGKELFALPRELASSPNRENAMAAVLAARITGCPAEAIAKGLQSFRRPSHRLDHVAQIGGVNYFDDSKATNIGAVQSALSGMNKPVILIAGGRDKGGDYRLLAESVRRKVKRMVLIGEAREKIALALGDETATEMAESLEEAVIKAADAARAGDAVLLSPACASFDMFQSYAQRGEVFQQAVKNLEKKSNKIEQ